MMRLFQKNLPARIIFLHIHYFSRFLFYNHGKKIQEKLKISCDIATKGKIPEYYDNSRIILV